MPGFNPAASNVGYYRGGIAAAAAAAPAAGPFFHPRHSYMFEGGASLGFMGVVQQPQLQPFVQQQQFLPQGGAPRHEGSAGLPIALEMETGASPPPPVIGGRASPLGVTSPGASGSTSTTM